MKLRENIIRIIEENRELGKPLEFLQYVTRSDFKPIEAYPAVLILNEPFDWPQVGGTPVPAMITDGCTMLLLTEAVNRDELTEEVTKEISLDLFEKAETLVKTIAEGLAATNGIGNITFGQSDEYYTLIDSKPVMVMPIPVKAIII